MSGSDMSWQVVVVAVSLLVEVAIAAAGCRDGLPEAVALVVAGRVAGTVVIVARSTRPLHDVVAVDTATPGSA